MLNFSTYKSSFSTTNSPQRCKVITDLGGGYAAERQCDIAWGFNPKSVLIFFFALKGARGEKYF